MASHATLDAAGRLVIPQRLRRVLHLLPGTRLRVLEHGRGLLLEPVESEPVLLVRDGVKLLGGTLDGPAPTTRALREAWLDEQTAKSVRTPTGRRGEGPPRHVGARPRARAGAPG